MCFSLENPYLEGNLCLYEALHWIITFIYEEIMRTAKVMLQANPFQRGGRAPPAHAAAAMCAFTHRGMRGARPTPYP